MHGLAQHGFQAQGLCGQLQVVARGNVGRLVAAAVFVFHGVGHATGQKFDDVGLADEAQRVVPQRQGALHAHALGGLHAGLVGPRMHGLAAQGVHVVVKHLLQVDQAALARAVLPVLQGRQGNEVGGNGFINNHRRLLVWVRLRVLVPYGFLGSALVTLAGFAAFALGNLGAAEVAAAGR